MQSTSQSESSLPFYYKILLLSLIFLLFSFITYGIYSYINTSSIEKTRKALVEVKTLQSVPTREQLENVLQNAPKDMKAAIAFDMGNMAMQEGKYEEAKESYTVASDSSSDTMHVLGILGEVQVLMELNQTQEAIAILKNLEKTLPEHLQSAVLFTLAQAQEDMNLKDDAVKSYSKLLSMDIENKNYIQYRIQKLASSY